MLPDSAVRLLCRKMMARAGAHFCELELAVTFVRFGAIGRLGGAPGVVGGLTGSDIRSSVVKWNNFMDLLRST